ncbi:hypothetical protein SLEP1_g4962 [Rubroshorea leprosula]|uniref:Uncharacterized protein n=1 Tax=Rubroshorea leprosula TaxID=152421 RepID=A0AAV5HZX7_9ROSI|nr:hypothetical protein SLEP1_g4962 [Rubroshorea leprosula]
MPWKKTIQPFRVSITKEQGHRLCRGFHLEDCKPMCLATERVCFIVDVCSL